MIGVTVLSSDNYSRKKYVKHSSLRIFFNKHWDSIRANLYMLFIIALVFGAFFVLFVLGLYYDDGYFDNSPDDISNRTNSVQITFDPVWNKVLGVKDVDTLFIDDVFLGDTVFVLNATSQWSMGLMGDNGSIVLKDYNRGRMAVPIKSNGTLFFKLSPNNSLEYTIKR